MEAQIPTDGLVRESKALEAPALDRVAFLGQRPWVARLIPGSVCSSQEQLSRRGQEGGTVWNDHPRNCPPWAGSVDTCGGNHESTMSPSNTYVLA